MLTLFLVPSVPARDEAAFWQLQLLGHAYGFDVKMAQRSKMARLSAATSAAIRDSDIVVIIATRPLNAFALAELTAARRHKRPILAVVEAGLRSTTGIPPDVETVEFRRGSDISHVATGIVRHLRDVLAPKPPARRRTPAQRAEEDNMTVAVGWIVGVGLGLLALAALSRGK